MIMVQTSNAFINPFNLYESTRFIEEWFFSRVIRWIQIAIDAAQYLSQICHFAPQSKLLFQVPKYATLVLWLLLQISFIDLNNPLSSSTIFAVHWFETVNERIEAER